MAPATTDEPSAAARGRLESLSQVAGVLGAQWGDEGKGKLVDILAQRFDVVARCQVSLSLARASREGAMLAALLLFVGALVFDELHCAGL